MDICNIRRFSNWTNAVLCNFNIMDTSVSELASKMKNLILVDLKEVKKNLRVAGKTAQWTNWGILDLLENATVKEEEPKECKHPNRYCEQCMFGESVKEDIQINGKFYKLVREDSKPTKSLEVPEKLNKNKSVQFSSDKENQRELLRQHTNKINEILEYLKTDRK